MPCVPAAIVLSVSLPHFQIGLVRRLVPSAKCSHGVHYSDAIRLRRRGLAARGFPMVAEFHRSPSTVW